MNREQKLRRAVARARRALDEVDALLAPETPKGDVRTAQVTEIQPIVPNDLQRAKARRWLRSQGIGAR